MPLVPDLDSLIVPAADVVSRRERRHTLGRLLIELENTGPGKTPQEGDDYVRPLLDRIDRYVATVTEKNKYPHEAGGQEGKTFIGDVLQAGGDVAVAIWETTSETGMFDETSQDPDPEVRRTLGRNTLNVRSTDALMEVEEKGVLAGIPVQVLKVLEENQVDSPTKPHNSFEGKTENGSRNTGTIFSHGTPGKNRHDKRWSRDLAPPPAEIGIKELKRLGVLMMLKGSGELITPTNLKVGETEWNNQNIASTLLPSLTRLGQSIPTSRFGTAELLQEINPDFYRREELQDGLSGEDSVPSYGAPWNPFVPFSGLGGAPAAISCALLATTVAGILKGLAELVVFAKGGFSESGSEILDVQIPFLEEGDSANKRTRMGSYLEKPKKGLLDQLTGLVDIDTVATEAPYFKALSEGIDVFFRLDQDTDSEGFLGVLEGLGMTAANFIEEYGWFSVILRNLFQSTTDVFLAGATAVAQVADPGSNFTTGGAMRVEHGTQGSPSDLNRITGVLSILETLNSSYLLKFMNVLATIGDIRLMTRFMGDGDDPIEDLIDDVNHDDSSLFVNYPVVGSLHMKDRISMKVPGFSGEVAWSGRNLPSLYLVPQNVIDGATALGVGDNFQGLAGGLGARVTSENRISQEDVQKVEDYLNASYMPFWFQDLRTNEVISFHAFLTNVQDQFDADYEETEGYGRPGKSYAWKNTDRKITLEFMVVATSIEDFHQMWWKIDKLITLVYPQYTRGRVLEFEGKKFVQPFSQLPSSTPLIRLRLGDLFKSNFSKFGLARVFGVASGQDSFALDAIPQTTSATELRQFRERLNRVRAEMLSGRFANLDTVTLAPNVQSVATARRGRAPGRTTTGARPGAYIYPRVSDSDIGSSVTDSALGAAASQLGGGGAALTRAINARGGTRTDARLAASFEGNARIVGPAGSGGTPISIPGLGGAEGAPAAYLVTIQGFTGIYMVPTSALSIHEAMASQAANSATRGTGVPGVPGGSVEPPSVPGGVGNPLDRFFSSEENPIVKSFDSVRGSGLPGVIKSIGMDWSDATWETSTLGARAPKICKISIDFAPVHDLNPGIDHNGFNTAPVYGVGKFGEMARGRTSSETQTEQERFRVLRNVTRE